MKKPFAAHAQKYHPGYLKWRVLSIEFGPDAGGFYAVEGPLSWEEFDKWGNLGVAHTADWAGKCGYINISKDSCGYAEYSSKLSNVAITDYTEKLLSIICIPNQLW